MTEEGSRFTTYMFISLWKIALFFCLFLLLSTTVGSISNIDVLFDEFYQSFQGTTGYYLVSNGSSNGIQVGVDGNFLPWKILATQIGCAFALFIFGTFACKTNIQIISFAIPITLIMPVTQAGLFALCDIKNNDACAYTSVIPSHVWFQCPSENEYMTWFGDFGSFIGIIWFLSSAWVTKHIWFPKSQRMASTEQMFGRPYYSGLLFDQDISLNKRSDSGERIVRLDIQAINGKLQEEEQDNTISSKDRITRIKGCATMWHENSAEMCEMMKSIFRMDEDYCARKLAKTMLKVEDKDNYEWETHIFFDDAFEPGPDKLGSPRQVNQFVKLLIKQVDIQGKTWYGGRKMKVPPATKYSTPYGGRLVWTLPGETKIVCHLKDKDKIRHKKRWSQCMYMYFFLGHQIDSNEKLTAAQKKMRARNTYLLALDGDVDFQHDAIIKLVDLMKRNPEVGASCGRIHPTGSGVMQWYQMFEYALGHWLQKSTEHVLGCVLCSPGCFSLFRGEALMSDNVMNTYTTVSTQPKHYIQYDQGEDRWLCTLLLQQGWRVEYSAASDSFTACPESFKEFYNQRRRWMPSTLANIIELLGDYKRVIKNNNDMSIFYILYQVIILIFTLTGPGMIFIMLIGTTGTIIGVDSTISLIINAIPLLTFIIVCFFAKADSQIYFAQILTVIYAMLMMAVPISMALQFVEDTLSSPNLVAFGLVFGPILIAGILHPQEISCLPSVFIWWISIPSMYLLLVIYSFFNMNNVSWGTREVTERKSPEQMAAEKLEAEEAAKKKAMKKSFLGTIFGGNSDGIDLKMRNIFNSNKDENSDMKKVLERLDDQTDKLEKLEMAINEKGYKIPVQPEKQETSKGATLENVPESPKKGVSFRLSNPPVEVSANKDLFWIEDIKKEFQTDGLGDGEERKLRNKELMFWDDLIAKYLKPLTQTKEDKADASNGLKELRNNTTFSFLIVNCIVILVVFLLQNRTDILGVQWPIPKENPEITWDEEKEKIHILFHYNQIEPVGFMLMGFFLIIVIFQMFGMFAHRLMTLGHIVSSRHIRKFGKKKAINMKKDIEQSGVSIMKDMIQNVETDEKDEGIGMVEAVEKSVDALIKGDRNSKAYRRMSNESDWSRGKSKLHRTETMNFIKDRATEWRRDSKKAKKPNIGTNEVIVPNETNTNPVELVNSQEPRQQHVPVQRTNTYLDPENLNERDA